MLARLKEAGLLWPSALACAGLAVLLGLGTWQLKRKAWKEGLINRIEARSLAEPVEIEALLKDRTTAGDVEYTRVTATGRFLPTTLWMFATSSMGPGWHAYSPLTYAPDAYVWVNRGFVPDGTKSDPSVAPPTGTITITGLARAAEKSGPFTPENNTGKNIWYWRDLAAMDRSANVPARLKSTPFSIDAELGKNGSSDRPYPRGGTTIVKIPNKHLEYAVTWYGLALTLVAVFAAFARTRFSAARRT